MSELDAYDYDDDDSDIDEDEEIVERQSLSNAQKLALRRKIEERLEQKRLREEFDLDDWD